MRNYIANTNRQTRWADIPAALLSAACQTKLAEAITQRDGKLISDMSAKNNRNLFLCAICTKYR